MENTLISIALTTYNGEKFINEQIDSILNQTITDWELIICDDCSSDSTLAILNSYAKEDSRIHVYVNDVNLGFKKNFEKAINLCTGCYIALSDQDDVWLPDHLEILYKNIGDHSASGGNAELIDSSGNTMNKKLDEVEGLMFFPENSKFLWRLLLNRNPVQGASMLLSANFIKGCLPIPENVRFHDAWFLTCACFEAGITYTFDVITKYRQHGNNVTFASHNKCTRPLPQIIESKFSVLFGCAKTDRLDYIMELEKRYGLGNEEFRIIKSIVDNIVLKKFSIKDIFVLWKNYSYINTQKNHKGFIKKSLIWRRWQAFDSDTGKKKEKK